MITILMTLFTDFCDDIEMRYNVGWVFISLILINLIANFGMMLYEQIRIQKLIIIKYYRRIAYYLKENCKKKLPIPELVEIDGMETAKRDISNMNILIIDDLLVEEDE